MRNHPSGAVAAENTVVEYQPVKFSSWILDQASHMPQPAPLVAGSDVARAMYDCFHGSRFSTKPDDRYKFGAEIVRNLYWRTDCTIHLEVSHTAGILPFLDAILGVAMPADLTRQRDVLTRVAHIRNGHRNAGWVTVQLYKMSAAVSPASSTAYQWPSVPIDVVLAGATTERP